VLLGEEFRRFEIKIVAIFTLAALEPAHNKGCGHLPKVFGHPYIIYLLSSHSQFRR
jgi:hypothetical protein